MTTTAIIVDDEATLVTYLADKLKVSWPDLNIVGTALNGRQAIALATETQPDIAFLDIHMPGLSGLQVAEALPSETKIVFVTAYDEFAVDAFERAAVDYILKPVTDARLTKCIERLQTQQGQARSELISLLREINPAQSDHLQWIRSGLDDTTQLVAVDEVVFFRAEQKYTSVFTTDTEHLVRRSIKQLEGQLDAEQFWRIHRGIIVRVDQIQTAKRDLRGRYAITLRDRPEILRCSQSYGHLFKQM